MLTVLGCIDGRLYLLRNYSLVHSMVGVVGKDRARPAILWEIVEGTKLVPTVCQAIRRAAKRFGGL